MFSAMDKHSIRAVQPGGGVRKVILVALAVSLTSLSFPNFAWAGPESDPNLIKLEMKFFEHDYSKDDLTARLSRLERLVFGESKSGDPSVRLKNLVAAVPNLNETADQSADAPKSSGSSAADRQSAPPSRTASRPPTRSVNNDDDDLASREKEITKSSQYPAVSAIEQKVLGHDYASDPIAKRLDRLETKVFGKPSQSDDLSERVDMLKSRTGVDLASTPPPGTEWADDDEDMPRRGGGDITYVPADTKPFSNSGSRTPATNLGGSRGIGGGSGSYGMGSRDDDGYSPGGAYGYNPPRKIANASPPRTAPNGMPPQAPDVVREPSDAPPAAMGLNQRVSLLENELFNKTYVNDTLPGRIARLENTVFPGRKTPPDMSLPERVGRLADAVGTSPGNGGSLPSKRVAQRDPDDLGDDPDMPRRAPPRSGLSKVIGGLGALLGGGGYGAYPMGNSNLITDPSTGMLVDMYSGNIIDPRTGAVVGNRSTGIQPGTFGALPYSGFNNGLSPLGAPMTSPGMGMGSGMRFGTGFGGGGMRFGGMGLGTGMGSGMGIWP